MVNPVPSSQILHGPTLAVTAGTAGLACIQNIHDGDEQNFGPVWEPLTTGTRHPHGKAGLEVVLGIVAGLVGRHKGLVLVDTAAVGGDVEDGLE